ncbi:hypothetical protein COX95_00820 [bacterium CG_4_10_14_0_2_um_filter_33_32]|nr:MAG: hypothetical protein AUJ93_02415 [bacterium CG2_30_33_46]PIR67352.1 MAG: hypothetical protein COU50_03480 [bacterium CG10_big_fil_rev_8_21_14_0_10_33_18]PIU76739.1 MAG: hypothetical protein COS74_02240 [bacterium CG06_land_8_20_14_3_00_33_50]PIW81315.1 MAG: hypothetical protein COZ97_02645 [bacterium CG_4_8_14_3_um_filter_33_28]PIY85696.1 MAG: hypothetical protein COY76_00595 [bacterium CG_4_10_14_0_8_um_filter_33_57]PIZ86601.1 MAG: hypothetical protein COX95_00820 [bacterium CG_4_10_1
MSDEKIIQKLIEHDERFEAIENKMDKGFENITNRLEEIVGIIRRLDQERIFTKEWVRRIEEKVEDQQKEISKIKQVLKIA